MKSVKSLNRILWATEYCLKALKYQISLTKTKAFFWKSEANVETLQKCYPYIWVFDKFVLKSVKILNRILWASEYWFKALKCQFWLTNTTAFLSKKEAKPWPSPKTFSLYLGFLQICFEVCQKPKSKVMSFGILAQGFKMPNLVNEYKTIFWESGANVKTLQKFSPYIRVF